MQWLYFSKQKLKYVWNIDYLKSVVSGAVMGIWSQMTIEIKNKWRILVVEEVGPVEPTFQQITVIVLDKIWKIYYMQALENNQNQPVFKVVLLKGRSQF